MNLYEINTLLLKCVDEETGEITSPEAFDNLQLLRSEKIEGIGVWIKNLKSDAEQLKHEIDILTERKRLAEKKVDRLKKYLDSILCGERFESSRVVIYYRRSQSVETEEGFEAWAQENGYDEYLSYKEPVADKTAIKNYIKNGGKLKFASLVEHNSLNIR